MEGFGLKEHAGAGAVFFAELIAAFDAGVAIVADDGVAVVGKVAADLVEAAGFWGGFDQGEFGRDLLEDPEVGFCGLGFAGFVFCESFCGDPVVLFRSAINNSEIGFGDFVPLESEVKFSRHIAVGGEE